MYVHIHKYHSYTYTHVHVPTHRHTLRGGGIQFIESLAVLLIGKMELETQ